MDQKCLFMCHAIYERCLGMFYWISTAFFCKIYHIKGVGGWAYGYHLAFCVKNIMEKTLRHLLMGLKFYFVCHTLFERFWGMTLWILTAFFCNIYHIKGFGDGIKVVNWHFVYFKSNERCWGTFQWIKNALLCVMQYMKGVGG